MLRVNKLYVDYSEYDVIDNDHPAFSWSAVSELSNSEQTGYEIEVSNKKTGKVLWTGGALKKEQRAKYEGPAFEAGEVYCARVRLTDNHGRISNWSAPKEFTAGKMEWQAGWIAVKEDKVRVPAQFYTSFENKGDIAGCVIFVCGVGYHRVSVNGQPLKRGELAPSYTNFAKLCCYEVLDAGRLLKEGVNDVAVTVADGWRRMDSQFIFDHIRREIEFFGAPQLSASIKLSMTDGSVKWIHTDNSNWGARRTPIIEANLYDGMVYDERLKGREEELTVINAPALGVMRADAAEPITMHEVYKPVSIFWPRPGVAVVDFGQNIAGFCRLRLPEKMLEGQTVVIEHAEMLDEDGTLYMAPLRGVKARDEFISSGREYNNEYFSPAFTYHGFRYAQISGYEDFSAEDIEAVALYSDMASGSFFECGSPMLNRIHKNCVQTEKSNIYSIFTDCPQRNERMAWINDLTPRFGALPYNFNVSRLFTKTVRDIINDQQDGMIAYTNPYIYSALNVRGLKKRRRYGLQRRQEYQYLHARNADNIAQLPKGACYKACKVSQSVNFLQRVLQHSYYIQTHIRRRCAGSVGHLMYGPVIPQHGRGRARRSNYRHKEYRSGHSSSYKLLIQHVGNNEAEDKNRGNIE